MSTTKPTTSHVESDTKPDADHLEIRKSNLSESDLGVEEISDLKYINLPPLLQHMTQEELRTLDKTTRKIDLRLMPMLIFIYILNYLDRNNLASARLGGLEKILIWLVTNTKSVFPSCLLVTFFSKSHPICC